MNKFEVMVSDMRECQKKYFTTRSKYWLEKSKEFEKSVDLYLNEKKNPKLDL